MYLTVYPCSRQRVKSGREWSSQVVVEIICLFVFAHLEFANRTVRAMLICFAVQECRPRRRRPSGAATSFAPPHCRRFAPRAPRSTCHCYSRSRLIPPSQLPLSVTVLLSRSYVSGPPLPFRFSTNHDRSPLFLFTCVLRLRG